MEETGFACRAFLLGSRAGFAKVCHRMSRLPLSISIISLNEEGNLKRCLASVADMAQEIVIVDSGSTDRTAEIAAEFGARFVHQDWLGYTAQKNHCLQLCTQPWVLALDCDEELSPALRDAVQRFLNVGITNGSTVPGCRVSSGSWGAGFGMETGIPIARCVSFDAGKAAGKQTAVARCMSVSTSKVPARLWRAICGIILSATSSTTS